MIVKSLGGGLPMLSALTVLLSGDVVSAEVEKEGSFDIMPCFSGSVALLNFDKQHLAWSFTADGPVRSNEPDGAFDMMWQNCVGSGGAIEGTRYLDMSCEYRDSEGNKIFMGQHYIQKMESKGFLENNLQIFAGTGRYEGIRGDGEFVVLIPFPEEIPDRFWNCAHWRGNYKLP